MTYFDTHIHLQDFEKANIIDLLKTGEISKCICVSAKQEDWSKVAFYYEQYPDMVIPAFGLHPWYINTKNSDWIVELEQYLQQYSCAMVGECGFDRLKNPVFEEQNDIFLSQINLAKKYKRALLVHAVKADIWLKDFWNILPIKTVFHSFNAHIEQLKPIVKNGCYVGLNINILKNKNCNEIIRQIPKNKMLIETDAPYQSGVSDLELLVKKIAEIRNEKLEDLSLSLYANAMELRKNEK